MRLAVRDRYAIQLTPAQLEIMARCEPNSNHPGGPEAHRLGLIAMAQ